MKTSQAVKSAVPPSERTADWVRVGNPVVCYIDDHALFYEGDTLEVSDCWIRGTVLVACVPGSRTKESYVNVRLSRPVFERGAHRPRRADRSEVVLRWHSPNLLLLKEYLLLKRNPEARREWQGLVGDHSEFAPYSLEALD